MESTYETLEINSLLYSYLANLVLLAAYCYSYLLIYLYVLPYLFNHKIYLAQVVSYLRLLMYVASQ